jgi:hypothetical protein
MEIELYSKLQNPIEAIERMGIMFAKSGLAGCDRVEQGQMLAWICVCTNKSPIEIMRTYDIIDGKLRKKALAALADFRTDYGGRHVWLKSGDEDVENPTAEIQLTDRDGKTITYTYSMEDAKAEGLIRPGSRWTKGPGNMLRARCISNGLGMICPEVYAGDDEPTPAKEIKLEPTPPPAEPKKAMVLEVVTSPAEDAKVEAAMGLAPDPKPIAAPVTATSTPIPAPTAEPKPFAAGPAYSTPKGNALPNDMMDKVVIAIGDQLDGALAWMVKNGWLVKGQGLEALTEPRAKRIINQRDSFLRAIGGAA